MKGFRTNGNQAGGNQKSDDGIQRLKEPGWYKSQARKEKPNPMRSLLGDHWGKVAMGTAAAIVVGLPYLNSHIQLNEEHPEFSGLSIPGAAQRVNRTWDHLSSAFSAAYYRTPEEIQGLKETIAHKTGSAMAPYAIVCIDKDLVAQADRGHPHALAYLNRAEHDIEEQLQALSQQDAIFYKAHVKWDPDAPVPAPVLDLDYNKMWYPPSKRAVEFAAEAEAKGFPPQPMPHPTDLKRARPVAQWIVESGVGICPDSKIPYKRDLKF